MSIIGPFCISGGSAKPDDKHFRSFLPIVWLALLDYIGQSSRLTEHQLKEMASSELISVQAAMETYTMLDYLSMDELTAIVSKAKTYVNTLTGRDPLAFAYSVGSINTAAKNYCASQFRFCVRRSSERPYDTSKDDGSLIYRYTIVRETPLENFALWLSKSK